MKLQGSHLLVKKYWILGVGRLEITNLLNEPPPQGTFVDHLRLEKSRAISKHITHKLRGWMERREMLFTTTEIGGLSMGGLMKRG